MELIHIADDLTVTLAEDEDTNIEVQMPQAHDAARNVVEEAERERQDRRLETKARHMKITEGLIRRYGFRVAAQVAGRSSWRKKVSERTARYAEK